MTDDRPSIVFLTPVLPASGGNGLAMRAGLFLDGMARRHAVTVAVVPVAGPPRTGDRLAVRLAASCLTLSLADPDELRRWPSVLLATPEGRHRARRLYPLPALCRRPSARAERELQGLVEQASLVHIMRSYLAPCLDFAFDDQSRPPITLDVDELDSGVQRQLGCQEQAERFERLERYYIPRADQVYTAAAEDARIIRECYGARQVSTVANAVRPPAPAGSVDASYDLLFVGNLSYPPNVDAARWLCEQIRPLLGEVTIAVVGSAPGPETRALAALPGVTVAADVPDVSPWYAAARIAVAPLRIGGGTRTKIVEALAHGRPVVTTPVGASGLEVGEDRGVLTASTTEEFAAICRRLMRDPAAAARIAAAGQPKVTMAEEVAGQIDRLSCAARAHHG